MPKRPRFTPKEAEAQLLISGYRLIRTKGSHRIYQKSHQRIVLQYHAGKTLHPKIVKQVMEAVEERD